MYKNGLKRILDLVVALIAFFILSPVFLVIALLLAFHFRGSPFFMQQRPGMGERIFSILKFKTMSDRKDSEGKLLPDSDRLTSLGRAIRSSSLDEIPQLLNVIAGQMSLIGPRPLLVAYLPLYNEHQKKRHEVRPGITGWAQVHGRNAISWEEKFDLDVYYVQNVTFMLDLRIVLATVSKVFRREGISSRDSVTMEVFKGTNTK
ncbi:MAG: sugar transferase [Bacteroidota bacterium]